MLERVQKPEKSLLCGGLFLTKGFRCAMSRTKSKIKMDLFHARGVSPGHILQGR